MSKYYFEHRVTKKRTWAYHGDNVEQAMAHVIACSTCRPFKDNPDYHLVEVTEAASEGYSRELLRLTQGVYRSIPWKNETFYVEHHCAHVSSVDSALVAFLCARALGPDIPAAGCRRPRPRHHRQRARNPPRPVAHASLQLCIRRRQRVWTLCLERSRLGPWCRPMPDRRSSHGK